MSVEQCRLLSEAARASCGACAFASMATPLPLHPGAESIVQTTWKGATPEKAFMCGPSKTLTHPGLDVYEGVQEAGARSTLLMVQNTSPMPIIIEPGMVLAVPQRVPECTVIQRKDVHPETGEYPELMVADAEGYFDTIKMTVASKGQTLDVELHEASDDSSTPSDKKKKKKKEKRKKNESAAGGETAAVTQETGLAIPR